MLQQHDDIKKGTPNVAKNTPTVGGAAVPSAAPLVNINHEDNELEDDEFSQLSHR